MSKTAFICIKIAVQTAANANTVRFKRSHFKRGQSAIVDHNSAVV